MSDPRFFRKYLDILSESPVSEQTPPAAPESYYDKLSDKDKYSVDRRIGWAKRNMSNVTKRMGPHEDPEVEELFQQSRDWVLSRQTDPERLAKSKYNVRQQQQNLRNQPRPVTGTETPAVPAKPAAPAISKQSNTSDTAWDNDIEIDSKFDKYPNAKAEIERANAAARAVNPNIVVRKPGTKDEDW
jgi:hypothetical protein